MAGAKTAGPNCPISLLDGTTTLDRTTFDRNDNLFYLFIYLSQTQKRPYMHTHAKKKKKKKKYQP